jgi:glutamine amidotransferase-like uncharacterized protein
MKRVIVLFFFFSLAMIQMNGTINGAVVINEVLFDPYGAGDANGDGDVDFQSDEFIELMNSGEFSVDIGGWTLLNSQNGVMFTFPPSTTLAPGELCVVFGGVDSSGFGDYFPSQLKIYSAGGGFLGGNRNNLYSSNENVILKDASNQAAAEVYWGTATAKTAVGIKFASPNTIDGQSYLGTAIDQSVTRETDGTGLWAKHSDLTGGLLYSPGALNTGEFYSSDYCWSYGSSASSYIDSFTIGGKELTSGATTYSDYTSHVIYLAPGGDVEVTLHKGDSASCYLGMWIDYNGDGDFNDVGEEIFSRGPLVSYTTRTLSVPEDISIASTRLRIAVKQGSAPLPCETGYTGEVEDYSVVFRSVVMNEVLFDPYGAGDANGDGTQDFRSDEFVEFMNISGSAVDIGDWTLHNETDGVIFTFPSGTSLQPGELCVVFGGVNPAAGFGSQFPQSLQIFASQQAVDKGFEAGGNDNLHSAGENLILRDTSYRIVAEVYWGTNSPLSENAEKLASPYTVDGNSYDGTDINQSVGRLPDGAGLWAKHSFLMGGAIYSPGELNTDGSASPSGEGYYKVLFMDGGVNLTSRTTLPAADYLNISMEYLATSEIDTQSHVMISNAYDDNGRLLYPDGEPRFRAIYTNGGTSTDHGISLGSEGLDRVRSYYYNGGSYTGSCAGAFSSSISAGTTSINEYYYHIWPGRTKGTVLFDTHTGHYIPSSSPLLNYYDFGGDLYISNVYHNGGCYANTAVDYPAGTEILLKYNYSSKDMHLQPSCWAYKGSADSGRVCVIGSHPESETGGERLQLMSAIIQYALDGQGAVNTKGVLSNGVTRDMDKSTLDNDPAYTKIGDKQYHHFTIDIPQGTSDLEITLLGEYGYDMNLYANPNNHAFNSVAQHKERTAGSTKTISIPNPTAGTWYIGVECATTVTAEKVSWGYEYYGNLDVLNGVSYSITATWNE